MVLLTVANRRTEKGETLAEASGRLDALPVTLRLSQRLGLLSHGGYARLSGVADEVDGGILGGSLRYEADRRAATAPPAGPVAEGTAQGRRAGHDDEA